MQLSKDMLTATAEVIGVVVYILGPPLETKMLSRTKRQSHGTVSSSVGMCQATSLCLKNSGLRRVAASSSRLAIFTANSSSASQSLFDRFSLYSGGRLAVRIARMMLAEIIMVGPSLSKSISLSYPPTFIAHHPANRIGEYKAKVISNVFRTCNSFIPLHMTSQKGQPLMDT